MGRLAAGRSRESRVLGLGHLRLGRIGAGGARAAGIARDGHALGVGRTPLLNRGVNGDRLALPTGARRARGAQKTDTEKNETMTEKVHGGPRSMPPANIGRAVTLLEFLASTVKQRSRCTLVRPVAGLSSPLAVLVASAMVATFFAVDGDKLEFLFFPPVLAAAFLVIALVASILSVFAEVTVEIGSDGLRLGRRYVPFLGLTDLVVDGDEVRLVSRGGTRRLYLRPGAVFRGLAGTLAALVRLQKYKSMMTDATDLRASRAEAHAAAIQAAGVSLREAWKAFRGRQAEVDEIGTRWRIDTGDAGGYRAGAMGDDELARAVGVPGLDPKIRVDAALALRRVDPERAVRVAEEAAAITGDPALERELRAITQA